MQSDSIPSKIENSGLIKNGCHVVVGLSGGPDSLCLIHALLGMRARLGITLSAVHVNHMLRAEADEDQRFVEGFCGARGVPVWSARADVTALAKKLKQTPEEAGRTLRYQVFDEAASRVRDGAGRAGRAGYSVDPVDPVDPVGPVDPVDSVDSKDRSVPAVCIALAHNREDQAETLLLRMLRGTGPDGLSGIPPLRKSEGGFFIIRPLLSVRRTEIEAYCRDHALHPLLDRTNEKPSYRRNSLRLELLPLLREKYNPAVEDSLCRLGRAAAEDRAYFSEVVSAFLKEEQRDAEQRDAERMDSEKVCGEGHPVAKRIRRERAAALHGSILSRVVRRVFSDLGLTQDMEGVHIDGAIRLIRAGGTGRRVEFPAGYQVRISYEWVIFERKLSADPWARVSSSPSEILASSAFSVSPELPDSLAVPFLQPSPAGSSRPLQTVLIPVSKILTGLLFQDSFCPMYAEILTADAAPFPFRSGRMDAVLNLDYDALLSAGATLILRTRRPGDRIRPEGMDGSRKIQDLFVDRKIPREERDLVPILGTQTEILWIPAIRKSRQFRPSAETKRLLRLTLQTAR